MVDIKDVPSMDEEGTRAFAEYLQGRSILLEYGCGGSTIFAAKNGIKHIFSIDSDKNWIAMATAACAKFGAKVTITYCDIGPTKEWGHPVGLDGLQNFHKYPTLPWKICGDKGVVPQLVLVDGRFRVACFLFSLLSARVGTPILFDDYAGRPEYHVVEKFCPLHEMRGRMGVFIAARSYSVVDLAEYLMRYSVIAA